MDSSRRDSGAAPFAQRVGFVDRSFFRVDTPIPALSYLETQVRKCAGGSSAVKRGDVRGRRRHRRERLLRNGVGRRRSRRQAAAAEMVAFVPFRL